jgi:hypothetical protein
MTQHTSVMSDSEYRENAFFSIFGSIPEPGFESPSEQVDGWGRVWGCTSDVGRLRVVLMHRPGDELSVVENKPMPEIGGFGDPEKGWYSAPGRMKQVYTRDSVIGVKGGAVAARLARRRNVVFPEPEGAIMETHGLKGSSSISANRPRRCTDRSLCTPLMAITMVSTPPSAFIRIRFRRSRTVASGIRPAPLIGAASIRSRASIWRRGRVKPRAGRWCSPDRAGARRGRRRVPDVYKLEDDEGVDAAHAGSWTLNEFIPIAGQAAADNIAPTIGQIQ